MVVRILLCHVLCLSAPASATAGHAEILREAREKLTEYYDTIKSISVDTRYQVTSQDGETLMLCNHWSRDGGRILYTGHIEAIQASWSGVRRTRWKSQCGGTSYSVAFFPESDLPPKYIRIREGQSIDASDRRCNPLGMVGGFAMAGHEEVSLADALKRKDAYVVGPVTWEGAECWRFDLGIVQLEPNRPVHRQRVILDPAYGFLIRFWYNVPKDYVSMYESGEFPPDFKMEPGKVYLWSRVNEFQEVDDPLVGKRWFPKRIESVGVESHIENVRINSAIPKSRFIPRLELGTEVITNHSNGEIRSRYVGGAEGQRLHNEWSARFSRESGEDVASAPDPETARIRIHRGPTINARERVELPLVSWLRMIACALITAASLVLVWRRRQGRLESTSNS